MNKSCSRYCDIWQYLQLHSQQEATLLYHNGFPSDSKGWRWWWNNTTGWMKNTFIGEEPVI